jgi:hypothetical protein
MEVDGYDARHTRNESYGTKDYDSLRQLKATVSPILTVRHSISNFISKNSQEKSKGLIKPRQSTDDKPNSDLTAKLFFTHKSHRFLPWLP